MKTLLLAFLVCASAFGQCSFTGNARFTVPTTTTGQGAGQTFTNSMGCSTWIMTWSGTVSAMTIQLEYSTDNVSWSAFPSGDVIGGSNPANGNTGKMSVSSSQPYIRANIISALGPGTVGYSATGTGGNGLGGVALSGTPTSGQVPVASSGTAAAWAASPGGPPTGPCGGDLSGTEPNCTVAQISGSSMVTGLVRVTVSAGVGTLSNPVAADITGLFSGCSGTLPLGADGACHAISSAFSVLTSATNTSAAMLIGSGASLKTTGTGSLWANQLTPTSDSTTAVKMTKADGTTVIVTVDTTNSGLCIGNCSDLTAGFYHFAMAGGARVGGGLEIGRTSGGSELIGYNGNTTASWDFNTNPAVASFIKNPLQLPSIPSLSGTRFLCIGTDGTITSSASACSGT